MADTLIVGGAGFIGSHLAKTLAGRGENVHVLARPRTDLGRLDPYMRSITAHRVDVSDDRALRDFFRACEPSRIYYVAGRTHGQTPPTIGGTGDLFRESVGDLIRIVEAAASAPRPARALVRTGTLAEYGAAPLPYDEAAREQPLTPYGAAAVAGTHYLSVAAGKLPFRIANARLALIYGPGQSNEFLVPLMIERCLRGEPITINDPAATRDLLYIDDLIEALIALSDIDVGPGPINICSGAAVAMGDAAKVIARATGAPSGLIRTGDASAAAGARHLYGDPERAGQLLGWRARTPFEEGIGRMIKAARGDSR